MKTRPLLRLGALLAVLASALVAAPAPASPGWLTPVPALGGHQTQNQMPLLAVAPSGRIVVGHITKSSEGAVEVQVRRPGHNLGAVTTLQASSAGVHPSGLQVAAGPGGTLGAVWWTGSGWVASFLPPGSSSWTSARPATPGPAGPTGPVVIDRLGRMWLSSIVFDGGRFVFQVRSFGATGAASLTQLRAPVGETFPSHSAPLVITPGGFARAVVKRTKTTFDNPGSPFGACEVDTRMIAADFVRGRATAIAVKQLATHRSTGTDFGVGLCIETGGAQTTQPFLQQTPTGTVATYSLGPVSGPRQLVAYSRPDGRAWQGRVNAGPASQFFQTGLTQAGRRLVAFGIDQSVIPNRVGINQRGPAGSWGSWRAISGAFGGSFPVGAGSGRGAVFAWHEQQDDRDLQIRRLTAGGALGQISDVTATANDNVSSVGVDAQGNAVVGIGRHQSGAVFLPEIRAFDAAGPALAVTVPRTIAAGRTFRVRATAVDTWSPPASAPVWHLDGGPARTGTSLTYVIRSPGRHRFVVRSVDARGTVTTVSRVVTVRAP